MKVERVLTDIYHAVRNILRALDNSLTPEDNMGPTRAPAGHVLTSVDPNKKPAWAPAGSVPTSGGGQGDGQGGCDCSWSEITGKPINLDEFGLTDDVLALIEAHKFDSLAAIVTDGENVIVDSGSGEVIWVET